MTKRRASSRDAKRRAVRRTVFRRTTKPRDPRNRLGVLLIFFAMIGAGFVALLIDLQAVDSEDFRERGEIQRTATRQLAGYRGRIVDRSGFVLAASTPSHQLIADPTMLIDPAHTATLLAPVLGIDAAELSETLTPSSENDKYALVSRTIPEDAVVGIRALASGKNTEDHMVGLFVRPEEDRVYPAGTLATPIVGRVDPDERGIYGIESQYDDIMTGIPGEEEFEKSRFGSISVTDWKVNPATAGYDVNLAIDHRVQYVTEEALRKQCETMGAKGATAVLTDPSSGEILAMAGVALDEETGTCRVPGRNQALAWEFEPGSVMKTITMAAAMEELGYDGDTMVDVPPSTRVGGVTFHDTPRHPGAPYPLRQILADSMNVGTIQVALDLGPTQVHSYMTRFGFGKLTDIGFGGEANGKVRDPEDWYGSDAASMPIGQGVTVTATQLVAAYNVVANGGQYQSPILVRSLMAPDGTEHPIETSPAKPVISEATAKELTEMLVGVVEDGTGKRAAIPGYRVAGKTGTAWKVYEDSTGSFTYGSSGERRYVATFAGFVPADNPRVSLVVVVDEPQTNWSASAVAAPVFAEVAEYALRILGVPPDQAIPVDQAGRVRAQPAPPSPNETAAQGGDSAEEAVGVAVDAAADSSTEELDQ